MTILPLLSTVKQLEKNEAMQIALALNNELCIPTKILNVKETQNGDRWDYGVEVQDCLDINEWDKLVRVFFQGYDFKCSELKKSMAEIDSKYK